MSDMEKRVSADNLKFDAAIVLSSASMSASDVARIRRNGKITMAANETGKALLEVGGVILAEGKIMKKRGKTAFVITKMLESGKEAEL